MTAVNPLIGAVVLHHRNWPGVAKTIESLRGQTTTVDVVLVDNASSDGSVDRIRAAFPDLRVVESATNGGYAVGMNLGVQHLAPSKAVLFVTHEVILAPDAVARMAQQLVGSVGMVGPLLRRLSDPDRVWSSGGWVGGDDLTPYNRQDVPDDTRSCEWIDGSCMLVERRLLDEVGPIDEGYFLYFEEVDLAFRARAAGWEVVCEPSARAQQEPNRPPPVLFTRNWLRFLARHRGGKAAMRTSLRWAKRSAVGLVLGDDRKRALLRLAGITAFYLRVPPRRLL